MANILDMPNEMIHDIVNYLDDKDILSMNATCKELRAATKHTFMATFGTDLTFDLTIQGMSHLHRLSRSSKRPYVKTVIFVHSGLDHTRTYEEFMEAARCLELKECAFRNLSVTGNLTSIGIRHADTGFGFEPNKQIAWKIIEHFLNDKILKRAQKSGLLIKNVIFEHEVHPRIYESHENLYTPTFQPHHHRDMITEGNQILKSMQTIKDTCFPNASHTIRFVAKGIDGTRKSASMTYSSQDNSYHGFHLTLNLQLWMRSWLSSLHGLRTIVLSDCDIAHKAIIRFFSSQPLESITTIRVRHFIEWFRDPGSWSDRNYLGAQTSSYWEDVFKTLLGRCTHLSYCHLSRLQNGKSAVYTGPTWEATGVPEVCEMLNGFLSSGRPMSTFKKAGVITTGPRKPRKKPVKNKKTRWTHKKSKPKK